MKITEDEKKIILRKERNCSLCEKPLLKDDNAIRCNFENDGRNYTIYVHDYDCTDERNGDEHLI